MHMHCKVGFKRGRRLVYQLRQNVERLRAPERLSRTNSTADKSVYHLLTPNISTSHLLWRYLLQMAEPYRVFVVTDRDYGKRLTELAGAGPVWIVDTPVNRTAAQQIWTADPKRSNLEGITTFKFREDSSPEDVLINELDTIDLHHGAYSADPPYTVLDVIGTAISPRVKAELAQLGFNEFQETSEGFRALRPIPSEGTAR